MRDALKALKPRLANEDERSFRKACDTLYAASRAPTLAALPWPSTDVAALRRPLPPFAALRCPSLPFAAALG